MQVFLVSWPGGSWEATLRYGAIVAFIFLSAFWIATVFWTYRDIRQRTRDPILQTAAVLLVLIFNFPGHWIYLIVRPRQTLAELYDRSLEEEALLQELEDQKACPTCKRRVKDEFLVCPSCRAQLKEACRECTRPLSYAWVACPYCGLEKPPREGFGPRPLRGQAPAGAPNRPQPAAPRAPAPDQRPQPARPLPRNITTSAPAPNPAIPSNPPRSDPFGVRTRHATGAGESESGNGPVIGE